MEGHQFTLFTDHKPLVTAIGRISPPWSDRQQRQLSFIAEFAVHPVYVAGKGNVEADTLSRPTWVVPTPESTQTVWVKAPSGSQDCSRAAVGTVVAWPSPPSVEAQQIYAVGDVAPSAVDLVVAQQEWPELVDILSSSSLTPGHVSTQSGLLHGDVSTGSFRPIVPPRLRKAVFDSLHNIAHPGVWASRRLVLARFVWPGLAKDVGE